MSKKSVAVRIAGRDYKILSDGDPDALQRIASYVDKAMDQVRARTRTVDTLHVSVLTCLNLAREILALRDPQNGAVDERRMRSLIENVESILDREFSPAAESADEASVADADVRPDHGDETRTIDLPSVDRLHERAVVSAQSDSEATDSVVMPETRVAAGGRDRAS